MPDCDVLYQSVSNQIRNAIDVRVYASGDAGFTRNKLSGDNRRTLTDIRKLRDGFLARGID